MLCEVVKRMAISDETLAAQYRLRAMAADYVDSSSNALTSRWATAWNELAVEWQSIVNIILARRAAGQPLTPAQVLKLERTQRALANTGAKLQELSDELADVLAPALRQVVAQTAQLTDQVIQTQLPPNSVAGSFSRSDPDAADAIVKRSLSNIVASSMPLPEEQLQAVRASLIAGVPNGWHPSKAAREILRRLQGSFSGGLARALRIARTEMLDAHRAANRVQSANNSAVAAVVWHAELGPRTCPSCIAKHGTEYPPGTPGPFDHPNGRCTFIPKTKSWSELGFPGIEEPPSMMQSADEWINENPEDAISALGPQRYLMYQEKQISLKDMSTRVENPDWRPSYTATSITDLRRKAAS